MELPPLFFAIHDGLPRQGPGADEATRRALALAEPLPPRPLVLDLGCGPGAQTAALAAALPEGRIVAVDNYRPFLAELARRARAAGHEARVQPVAGDLEALPVRPGGFDLVWSEGAIYLVGFARGLEMWRLLLGEGGRLAVSELCWLAADPPAEAREFWAADYPAMQDIAGCLADLEGRGFRPLGHFALPPEAWWDGYYRPLETRLDLFRRKHAGDAAAQKLIAWEQAEIDLFRRAGTSYGYVFFVAERI